MHGWTSSAIGAESGTDPIIGGDWQDFFENFTVSYLTRGGTMLSSKPSVAGDYIVRVTFINSPTYNDFSIDTNFSITTSSANNTVAIVAGSAGGAMVIAGVGGGAIFFMSRRKFLTRVLSLK